MIEASEPETDSPGSTLVFPAVIACWVLIVILGAWRYQGPAPLPADGPADRFSADRAMPVLQQVFGDHLSHESGSEHHAVIRKRIIDEYEKLGLNVEQHPCIGTNQSDLTMVDLVNLIVRLPGSNHGTADQKTIFVVSHYDSKPNAAGVSDDGVGVSVGIEIARMLKNEKPLNHDIVFIVTDGEELGLLGAQALVRGHPIVQECDIVINLEARGTSGPSLMFETNFDNARAIPIFNRAVRRPFCSSLFYEIYKRLPRDTDFRIFREAGFAGYNFAYIGDVQHYHTMNDSIQNLDRRSFQHHGDNVLGLIRELDQTDKFRPANRKDTVVYFDLFGSYVVYWPSIWSLPLLLIGAICNGVFLFRMRKFYPAGTNESADDTRRGFREMLRSKVFVGPAYLFTTSFVVFLCCSSVNLGLFNGESLGAGWVDAALLVELSFWLIAVAALFIMCWLFDQRDASLIVYATMMTVWLLFGIVIVFWIPGACYLFVVPALITGAASLVSLFAAPSRRMQWVFVTFAISVGLIWLPMERMFYDAVGFRLQSFLIARIILVSMTLLPVVMTVRAKWIPGLSILLLLLGSGSAVMSIVWGYG